MQFKAVTELDEFNGWDVGEISDNTLILEIKHAWRDYFQRHSCPLTLKPETVYPARDFCQENKIPFRFFLQWSIQILGGFPQPWQFNLRWLHEEVMEIWRNVKEVKIALPVVEDEAIKILEALQKKK